MVPDRDWVAIGATILGIVFPLGFQQWLMHRQNSEAIKRRDVTLHLILNEYPLHCHRESGDDSDPLTVGGLRYPHTKINGH